MTNFMVLLPQVIGVLAVVIFLLSYQQKKRKNIILLNTISRVLYIVQYILLGAFEGAALDILGAVSSVAAQKKEKFGRCKNFVFIIINFTIVVTGILLYDNIFSLGALFGVMLHTIAFWITDEKIIRRISFIGSPFWLIFNIANRAYGSAVGDVFTMLSIGVAILRYDIKGEKKNV